MILIENSNNPNILSTAHETKETQSYTTVSSVTLSADCLNFWLAEQRIRNQIIHSFKYSNDEKKIQTKKNHHNK